MLVQEDGPCKDPRDQQVAGVRGSRTHAGPRRWPRNGFEVRPEPSMGLHGGPSQARLRPHGSVEVQRRLLSTAGFAVSFAVKAGRL